MTNANLYRERLRQRQQQEHADKGKTGLGRKSVLDFSRAGVKTINFFTPRFLPEVNAFDILPFVITQDWYRKLRMVSGRPIGLEPGMWDYKLQVPVHRSVGPNNDAYICLREAFGGPCSVCDDMFEAYKAGDKKKAQDLRPGWRCFYNIYDYDDPDKGIQLFESSYYTFEATSKLDPQRANLIDSMMLDDKGPLLFYDLEEGKTILAKFKKKVLGKQEFAEISDIQFEARDPYTDEIFRQVYPLDSMLIIPKPEEVKAAHLDMSEEEINRGEGQEESKAPAAPAVSERKSRNRAPATGAGGDVSAPPAPSTGRARGAAKGAVAPAEKVQEELPWKSDNAAGTCPAGKVFGKDCNTGPECEGKTSNSCSEEIFAACSDAFVKLQNQTAPAPQEEKKEAASSPATGRTRVRR